MTPHVFAGLLLLLPPQAGQTQSPQLAVPVAGAKVIFFGPTAAERDSIVRAEGVAMGELFDDFDYHAGRVAAFLKERGIGVALVTTSRVVVRLNDGALRTFDRKTLPDLVGAILTDGMQDPRVLPGLLTDEELIPQCREFFRLR